jgi:hypothetical protein
MIDELNPPTLITANIHLLKVRIRPNAMNFDEFKAGYIKNFAEWLAYGIIFYRSKDRRNEAFAPVTSSIGTNFNQHSYLESISSLHQYMTGVQEENQFLDEPFPELKRLNLGELFSAATSKAFLFLLNPKFRPENGITSEIRFDALIDCLVLARITKCQSISEIVPKVLELCGFEDDRPYENDMMVLSDDQKWHMAGETLFALNHVCTAGTDNNTKIFLSQLSNRNDLPEVLKFDLQKIIKTCDVYFMPESTDFYYKAIDSTEYKEMLANDAVVDHGNSVFSLPEILRPLRSYVAAGDLE